MKDRKETLTKAELIEKINNERQTFKQALLDKDEECQRALAAVKRVSDMVIGSLISGYGAEKGNEYSIEIDIPKDKYLVAAEKIGDKYRIVAKKLPEEFNGQEAI